MTRVAVVGASGFVGSHVCTALAQSGHEVVRVRAPRLLTTARAAATVFAELEAPEVVAAVSVLAHELDGCEAVVNAAGAADATGSGHALFGANSLLPLVVWTATPLTARFVHVSSAAVQGRRPVLDESMELAPFSPYSRSKAVGELALVQAGAGAVLYRPTSVHGSDRAVTRTLVRLLRSPVASVAAGERATPQVLAGNVGAAVSFLVTSDETPPPVVLHPWEGLTTLELVRVLGQRDPWTIPTLLAVRLVGVGHFFGRFSSTVAGLVRRVEMLWLGQEQAPGWLSSRWSPPLAREQWRTLT